jgi:hypothetical protein
MALVPARSRRTTQAARTLLAALTTVVSTTGCYTYRSVTVSDLAPAMEVRMQLTAVATDRLRNSPNGEGRLLQGFGVDGTVATATPDSVVVSVESSRSTNPTMGGMTFRQPVTILRGEVRQVELRTLDKRKTTWVSIGLGVIGLAAAAYAIDRGGESTGTTPVPGGPNEGRFLPLFLRLGGR